MSSKNTRKRRCIIQKLDFENCIITNIKTATRGRKKLRARITREIEDFSDIPEEEISLNSSPVSTQAPEPTSPVLIKRNCFRESPVFCKRKKNSPEKPIEDLSGSSTIEQISPPSSPVFKSFKKQKKNVSLNPSQEFHNVLGRMTSLDMFSREGSSSSDLESSYQIDDFTQESNQSPSVKISSVESTNIKNSNNCFYSIEVASPVSGQSPAHQSGRINLDEKFENLKPCKRNYKKNSLLGRLYKLQKKQASEKLLWQHQSRKKLFASIKVVINSFWREDFNYFIKCRSVLSDSESRLLVVDSRWVPAIKNVKEGSVLQLHPPWQELTMKDSTMTVLLNLICLDVVDEFKEPVIQRRTTQSIPANMFEANQKLFLDSLFNSCESGFFF